MKLVILLPNVRFCNNVKFISLNKPDTLVSVPPISNPLIFLNEEQLSKKLSTLDTLNFKLFMLFNVVQPLNLTASVLIFVSYNVSKLGGNQFSPFIIFSPKSIPNEVNE